MERDFAVGISPPIHFLLKYLYFYCTSFGKYKSNSLINFYSFWLATIIFRRTSFISFCCYKSINSLRWERINLLAQSSINYSTLFWRSSPFEGGLEHLQAWRLYSFSGQPVLVFNFLTLKKKISLHMRAISFILCCLSNFKWLLLKIA